MGVGKSKSKAWGVCQRSGLRFYLHELVPDGRNPSLWVHPNYWEPPVINTIPTPIKEDRKVDHPSPELAYAAVTVHWPTIDDATGKVRGGMPMHMALGAPAPSF